MTEAIQEYLMGGEQIMVLRDGCQLRADLGEKITEATLVFGNDCLGFSSADRWSNLTLVHPTREHY